MFQLKCKSAFLILLRLETAFLLVSHDEVNIFWNMMIFFSSVELSTFRFFYNLCFILFQNSSVCLTYVVNSVEASLMNSRKKFRKYGFLDLFCWYGSFTSSNTFITCFVIWLELRFERYHEILLRLRYRYNQQFTFHGLYLLHF